MPKPSLRVGLTPNLHGPNRLGLHSGTRWHHDFIACGPGAQAKPTSYCRREPIHATAPPFTRSESLEPEECSVEELESGEMKAICTSEGKEYLYRVSATLQVDLLAVV